MIIGKKKNYKIEKEYDNLLALATNLRFSWNDDFCRLFEDMDSYLWHEVDENPVVFLKEIGLNALERKFSNQGFYKRYIDILNDFKEYAEKRQTWYNKSIKNKDEGSIAYFCLEFGIHSSLPVYSGGLGILAGDFLKTASDLGVPIKGVGLLYRQAYFTQQISNEGDQQSFYQNNKFSDMPLQKVVDKNSNQIVVKINIDSGIYARVWKAQVGRTELLLLDTDFEMNNNKNRAITQRLYVADREMRLLQEIVIGIGGVKALRESGYRISTWHINEGHSALLNLERMIEKINQGYSFDEALNKIRSSTVFTTHTPVPAGNEIFPKESIWKFLGNYCKESGIDLLKIIELADVQGAENSSMFNMTAFALRTSGFSNGVSRLHMNVSKKMWKTIWPEKDERDVPIYQVTNGVHADTWLSFNIKNLFDKYLGYGWREHLTNRDYWVQNIDKIPDEELWKTHIDLKKELIALIQENMIKRKIRNRGIETLEEDETAFLKKDVLFIGFARRFAAYKRAGLIFKDRDRLKKILTDTDKPVVIIFSGKAHPADEEGKELIRQIHNVSKEDEFKGHIIFVEDYNIGLARKIVSGVDVWLNNPVKPHEASGTSGMKAAINGVINFSILDGWWDEGYNGENGWAIEDNDKSDDSESLYKILEKEIIPNFYKRDEKNMPADWIDIMKKSISTILPEFNSETMLINYINKMYHMS